MTGNPLRLGVVPYLNVAPIAHGFRGDPAVSLLRDVPSRLRARLDAGELDAATIPSIDYARGGQLEIVPGIAIASEGPVRSVRLLHRVPLEQVRRVAVDSSSHTSVALLRVLLARRLGREPEYVTEAPDVAAMLEKAEAALVIGDAALFSKDERPSLDLGEEWTAQTGLPFVYAFWAAPVGRLARADVRVLQASLTAGLSAVAAIAATYDNHDRALCEAYLRRAVIYRFGEREQRGLSEFYGRCQALGIIDAVPELRFHGDP